MSSAAPSGTERRSRPTAPERPAQLAAHDPAKLRGPRRGNLRRRPLARERAVHGHRRQHDHAIGAIGSRPEDPARHHAVDGPRPGRGVQRREHPDLLAVPEQSRCHVPAHRAQRPRRRRVRLRNRRAAVQPARHAPRRGGGRGGGLRRGARAGRRPRNPLGPLLAPTATPGGGHRVAGGQASPRIGRGVAARRGARHRPGHRDRPGGAGVQPDARPRADGAAAARGQRGAAAPVRRRRVARAAHPPGRHPRLRRARAAAPGRLHRGGHARARPGALGVQADERPGRRPAAARPARRRTPAGLRNRWT